MAEPRRTSTRRAVLSYEQVSVLTEFPELMVKDYQGIFADFVANADSIDSLEIRIITNEENIQINADNFEAHDTSNTEHGVAGVNVGTENFCTDVIGGVVLLMESVNDAIASTQEIVLVDIAAAPALYDQTYTQLMADMANDTKAKHNQLLIDLNAAITQINDMITKAKTAKQMAV
ncbi:MAG TPA: hypothetical protein EYN54_06040 [Methylococcaceae bacterium]|nr:hypothetical protein [Methylococcaceae bacterium]